MAKPGLIASVLIPLVLLTSGAFAADPEVGTLREQLRSTVLQLRQLQDQQAQAAAAPTTASPGPDQAALQAKLAAAQAQLRTARESAAKVTQLQAALDKAQADNAALTATNQATTTELEKFKAAYSQAADAGQALTTERNQLTVQLVRMTNIATACQAKNTRLIAFAEDLLGAYKKVGFGQVVAAKEPFLGFKRVQLENIAQDREDAVRAEKCDTRADAAPPAKAARTPAAGPSGG